MKEITELNFPEDVRYSESHEWVKAAGETAKLGITDYAQDQLGDIVFVELPDVGESFRGLNSAPWNLSRRFQSFTCPSAEKLSPSMTPWKTPPNWLTARPLPMAG